MSKMSDLTKKIAGIKNGKILTPQGIVDNGIIRIDGSKISDIGDSEDILNNADGIIIDAVGKWVLPGFIDIHCHGGKGCDVMDGKLSDIETIARYHASGGTTAFLPTTASSSIESILQALDAVHQARVYGVNGAKVIGAHIEGPYFSYAKRGCHLPKFVRNPRPQEYNRMLEFSDDIVSMTLAPELDGAEELIKSLVKNDILVSIGHSDATYAQVLSAVNWGARHVTHLYCAMSSLVKNGPVRISGVVESALLLNELTVEFIADGRHVPPELIRLAIKAKGIDKVCVVTDAMRGAGMPSGVYTFGPIDGQEVLVQDEIAIMPDRTGYASTVLRMKDLVRTLIDLVGLNFIDAIKMASLVPAKIIGLDRQMGSLEKGKDANIIIADENVEVYYTIINGVIIED